MCKLHITRKKKLARCLLNGAALKNEKEKKKHSGGTAVGIWYRSVVSSRVRRLLLGCVLSKSFFWALCISLCSSLTLLIAEDVALKISFKMKQKHLDYSLVPAA